MQRVNDMGQDELNQIWKNCEAGRPRAKHTTVWRNTDGDGFIIIDDQLWMRKSDTMIWKEVPVFGGNL